MKIGMHEYLRETLIHRYTKCECELTSTNGYVQSSTRPFVLDLFRQLRLALL